MKAVFEWLGKALVCVAVYYATRYIFDNAGATEKTSAVYSTAITIITGFHIRFFKVYKDL